MKKSRGVTRNERKFQRFEKKEPLISSRNSREELVQRNIGENYSIGGMYWLSNSHPLLPAERYESLSRRFKGREKKPNDAYGRKRVGILGPFGREKKIKKNISRRVEESSQMSLGSKKRKMPGER